MRIIITGASGFVGKHLVKRLLEKDFEIIALDLNSSSKINGVAKYVQCDLRDSESIIRIVKTYKPEACVHLGAVSFVPAGESNPELMFSVNVVGTINLLEAFKQYAPESRILVISTAHVYGSSRNTILKEDDLFAPESMYAISKTAADLTSLTYAAKYGMYIMTARPNNHTGPGQSTQFVIPSFVRQIKAIATGKSEPVIRVGNTESIRDFTDVRDVVESYRLLIERGRAGEAYNISAQNMMKIKDILNKICEMANIEPEIIIDKEKFRRTDKSPLLDISKIRNDTCWQPEISISKTLQDMLKTCEL